MSVYDPLVAYVASLLLTFRISAADSAQDIVHETLLTFYERWTKNTAEIYTEAALRAYLRASCRNLLIDRYRREKNAERLVDYLSLKFSHAFQDNSELYRSIFLDEILTMMPPDCASLLREYVTEEISPAEIAERLGESPSKFYAKWYRCLQKAKKIYLQKKTSLIR
ncbi:MAG: sigma-70 family RNA polymerase sigma factor [Acidobacteria bacterium]|nr:sigma-70 family RNA polymerase sigma factor [Acidobacteriota bacterium]